MALFHTIYSKINKYILLSVGFWPKQSKIEKQFIFVFFSIMSLSVIIALGAGLFETWSTDNIIFLETVLAIVYLLTGFIIYTLLYFKQNEFIELNEKIAQDWEKLDETEFKILQSFTHQGQIIGFVVIVYVFPVIIIFGGITYVPPLLNINAKEYRHPFPYYTDYMIIEKYYYVYQIFIHSFLALFYVGLFWLALSSTFISSVKHICGMHTIICYRLRNIVESRKKLPVDQLKKEKTIEYDLINVINKHNETIHRVDMIEQLYSTTFFLISVAALISLATLMFDLKYNQYNVFQIFRILVIFILYVLYIFYIHWVGQQIIKTSNDILLAAYFLDWILLSTEARELLRMIIWRSCKTDKLTAGKIIVLSMESFASILRTSWSVATVLISTQRSK